MTGIVGGRWGGRRLTTPDGDATRPTSERVREAVANSLAARGLAGASVLDLYAGTGALGLELASRGAARVVFVESARSAQRAIESNIRALVAGEADPPDLSLVRGAALPYASANGEQFDIVLADPPYAESADALSGILTSLVAADRLRGGAEIVIERARRNGELNWPEPLAAGQVRRYGSTVICYGHAP